MGGAERPKSSMIYVDFSEATEGLRQIIGLSRREVITTVNDRHRGLLDPGCNRMLATHWFSPERVVFVDATVTDKKDHKAQRRVQIRQVRAMLTITLTPDLPAGTISSTQELEDLALVVAKSFGQPVKCHPQTPSEVLYTGPWDGQQIQVEPALDDSDILLLATLSTQRASAFAVWAFNITRYLDWWRRQVVPRGP